MSNPAVTELCRAKIGRVNFWMDDNIGESIHIHIDEIRVDLTNAEFARMFSDICLAINELIDVEEFDCRKLNADFLLDTLWHKLRDLRAVKSDTVPLKEMLCPVNGKYQMIPESETVKMLETILKEGSRSQRLENGDKSQLAGVLDRVKNNGRPFDGRYIIMFGEDNVIRDGQDYAACLWHVLGDVSVPVLRFCFDKENQGQKPDCSRSQLYEKKKKKTDTLTSPEKLLQKVSDKGEKLKYKTGVYKKYYMKRHKPDYEAVYEIFKNR